MLVGRRLRRITESAEIQLHVSQELTKQNRFEAHGLRAEMSASYGDRYELRRTNHWFPTTPFLDNFPFADYSGADRVSFQDILGLY
jgi:hypothetical protein